MTASNGLVGWGEAFWGGWQASQAAIEHWIAPLAPGQDVTDRQMSARFERALHNFGRSGPFIYALAGPRPRAVGPARQARRDAGHALLGGKKRDRVEVYASLIAYGGNIEHVKRNVARALERGYRHIKLHEKTTEAVAATRETTGPGIPIMVDVNCAWLPDAAHDAVMAMKPYDPLWVEEPSGPPRTSSSRKAAQGDRRAARGGRERDRRARIRAARGRRHRLPAAERGEERADRQWDICRRAEESGATCVPHSPYFGPGYLATLHILAAKEKEVALERFFCDLAHVPYGASVPIENGWAEIPDIPGSRPRAGCRPAGALSHKCAMTLEYSRA